MNYFADTAWEYVEAKVCAKRQAEPHGRVLVTVPQLPEQDLLTLADVFQSRCVEEDAELMFKVADEVWRKWSAGGQAKGADKGWIDKGGSLTAWRNWSGNSARFSLLVLCGTDRVTDAGSLADFNQCDPETLWVHQMRKSFLPWMTRKMAMAGLQTGTRDRRAFDRLLVPLLEHGKADLMRIGEWLDQIDITGAQGVRDVQQRLLDKMTAFRLPRFSRFPLTRESASLGTYIGRAGEFFDYSMFLEDKKREKAVETVGKLVDAIAHDEGPAWVAELAAEDVRGPYADATEFLGGLRCYIAREDRSEQIKLLECDFVMICDKILKYRKKKEPKEKPLRSVNGSPVEAILGAVWHTLHELRADKLLTDATPRGLRITATRFRHDDDSLDGDGDPQDRREASESALRYLHRLLGGVDELVNDRLELPGQDGQPLSVACSMAGDNLSTVYAKTAEPRLEFEVALEHDADNAAFVRKFAWKLPDIHSYRLADALLLRAKDATEQEHATYTLPVYHLPYYEEILRASDDEETRRVMLHCLQDNQHGDRRLGNLLCSEWLDKGDALLPHLKQLAGAHAKFVRAACKGGLHATLFGPAWTELRQAYVDACESACAPENGHESQMTAMLLRCFLMTRRPDDSLGASWATRPYEPSAVATVLHPAVLEMLEAQVVFLFACFNAASAHELAKDDPKRAFADSVWSGYVDLAEIRAPLVGLLHNEDGNLDTRVDGQELIHRLGSPDALETAPLSTRVLVRYDAGTEDDDVPDAVLFRETRESRLLFRLMTDYFRLHPHARDGLSLAVFRNEDIQPVVAAAHQYLNQLASPLPPYDVLAPGRRTPYALTVTVFTEASDDVGVARWIEQWRDRWEAAETEPKLHAYRNCRFSVAHRIVEKKQLGTLQGLIRQNFEADIAILYNFVGAGQGGNKFMEIKPFDVREYPLKFPILEKACCAVLHPVDAYKRLRVHSNRQFRAGSLHAQVMHALKHPGAQPGKEHVVVGVGDFTPWRGVVDALHAKSEWVVCIDPSMDERLVRSPAIPDSKTREIIGFGSGVGSHGEANFTISTEQFSLGDVLERLSAAVKDVYSAAGWTQEETRDIAEQLLRDAGRLSGLSLVRATGVGHYIRDFMAYALTRKMLQDHQPVLCDNLVSLDAYRHWFDLADSERRPDLLWLTARLGDDGRIDIYARLIECKVAQRSDAHLRKARAQIANGLRVLAPALAPRQDKNQTGDERPDRRYWWLQLHRLISSRAEIEDRLKVDVLSAMERLADGDYTIRWDAAVLAFWSDDAASVAQRIGSWTVSTGVAEVEAGIYTLGSGLVRDIALKHGWHPKTWDEWVADSSATADNVCGRLDDTEDMTADDDEDDMPGWTDLESPSDDDDGDGDVGATTVQDRHQEEQDEAEEPVSDPIAAEIPAQPDAAASETSAGSEPAEPFPPQPGGTPTPVENAPTVPNRILLGRTVNGDEPVYWEFGHKDLANRHMMVFGTSGMGKTYAIQCLLSEFGRQGQNSLIIDYTDGFVDSRIEEAVKVGLRPQQHYIRKEPLPINPFLKQVSIEEGMEFPDTPNTIGKRVAAIFKSVYDLGDQQFPILVDAVAEGVKAHGDNFTMQGMMQVLESFIDNPRYTKARVQGVMTKLRPFVDEKPFAGGGGDDDWRAMFEDQERRCHVLQFLQVDRHTARALIEFVLWDLYAHARRFGNKNQPKVVVLDEVQNLDLGGDAPVAKYLTEGRKFGICLIAATQSVKAVGGVNDARVSRLFQAEQKLFFKPTENEMREHAQLLHNAISRYSVQDWSSRLASLQRGECWSLGRCLNEATGALEFKAKRIRITSLEARGFHA